MIREKRLTHLSLFSGIGGLDLAAEMAGVETVGQCEWAEYQTKVLYKHWPDVPKWKDIRTLTGDNFYERTGLRTVDIISGGFPCQPFSVAGKRTGTEDDRFLWPEMLRVIKELRPTWVLGENVPGIINMALDKVLADLEDADYETQCFVIPACGVDAPHKRERIAIVAHSINGGSIMWWNREHENSSENGREGPDNGSGTAAAFTRERWENESGAAGVVNGVRTGIYNTNADTDTDRLQGRHNKEILWGGVLRTFVEKFPGMHSAWENWPDEPELDRVADGVPDRVDRIKCLGNAVVPQQFYPFFAAIVKIETGGEK